MVDPVSVPAASSAAPQAVPTSAEALQLALKATEAQSQALLDLLNLAVGSPEGSSTGSLIDLIA